MGKHSDGEMVLLKTVGMVFWGFNCVVIIETLGNVLMEQHMVLLEAVYRVFWGLIMWSSRGCGETF